MEWKRDAAPGHRCSSIGWTVAMRITAMISEY